MLLGCAILCQRRLLREQADLNRDGLEMQVTVRDASCHHARQEAVRRCSKLFRGFSTISTMCIRTRPSVLQFVALARLFPVTQSEAVAIIIGPDGSPYARAPYLFRFVFPWLGEEPASHL